MAKTAYTGVGGVAKKLKTIYIGVDGKAKVVKKAYVGVGGKAKVWWAPDGPKTLYLAGTLSFEWHPYASLPRQTDSQESDATPRLVVGANGVYRVAKNFSSVTPLWEGEECEVVMQGGTTSGYSDRMLVKPMDFTNGWSAATNDVRLHRFDSFSPFLYNGVGLPLFDRITPRVLYVGANGATIDLSTYTIELAGRPSESVMYSGASTKKTAYTAYNTAKLYARSTANETWSEMAISVRVQTMTAVDEKVYFLGYPVDADVPYSIGVIDPETSTVQMVDFQKNDISLSPIFAPRLKKADGTGKAGIYIGSYYSSIVTLDTETLTISYSPWEGGQPVLPTSSISFRFLLGHDFTAGGDSNIYHYAYRD
jgi:hypothetical protein